MRRAQNNMHDLLAEFFPTPGSSGIQWKQRSRSVYVLIISAGSAGPLLPASGQHRFRLRVLHRLRRRRPHRVFHYLVASQSSKALGCTAAAYAYHLFGRRRSFRKAAPGPGREILQPQASGGRGLEELRPVKLEGRLWRVQLPAVGASCLST